METHTKIIIFAIVLLIIFFVYKKYYGNVEPFNYFNSYNKRYCPSCNWRNERTCNSCLNCGFCRTQSGEGSCEPGDSKGPHFRNDCVSWTYGDAYQYFPNSGSYPVTLVKSQNPYFQKQIRKPYEWIKAETE